MIAVAAVVVAVAVAVMEMDVFFTRHAVGVPHSAILLTTRTRCGHGSTPVYGIAWRLMSRKFAAVKPDLLICCRGLHYEMIAVFWL